MLRRGRDGSYWIPRRNKKLETQLDKRFRRFSQRELKWYPAPCTSLQDVKHHFRGQVCYIVGKGPSLDILSERDFPSTAPIIGLNEAVHQVEKLGLKNQVFGLQQDEKLKDSCHPTSGILFVSIQAAYSYEGWKRVHVYDPRDYELPLNTLSVNAAISIARHLEAVGCNLISFDACINQHTDYAKCVGSAATQGGKPERFLSHRQMIENCLGDFPVIWTIPGDPA